MTKPLIYDLDYSEIESWAKGLGEPAFRTRQLWDGLYKHYWNSLELFTPLPRPLCNMLGDVFSFSNLAPSVELKSSDKNTEKILFTLPDESKIETVLMKYGKRYTLCISSQSGCAMGCSFCATGQMGFKRNLSPGEIIEQVLFFSRRLKSEDARLTNIVLMGMGEPFHNYDAVMKAIQILNHPSGMKLGERRFTISTVGIIPGIQRFTQEHSQVNLAISLHAADNELRSSLMPVNRRYPLALLLDACQEYVDRTHRRISFEWALIDGVNDSVDQAKKLVKLLARFSSHGTTSCHVNLIPLNPTLLYKGHPTSAAQAAVFSDVLQTFGVPCTIRLRRGIDIRAGCGQLAFK